jgi:hypothetical protein
MAGGNNAFVWHTSFLAFSDFAGWVAISGEKNSVSAANSTVNLPAGTLQSGSPAIGAGANLYNLCNGQPNPGLGALCFDANGKARPSSGAWDAGAFSVSTGNNPQLPQPPTNVTAAAH